MWVCYSTTFRKYLKCLLHIKHSQIWFLVSRILHSLWRNMVGFKIQYKITLFFYVCQNVFVDKIKSLCNHFNDIFKKKKKVFVCYISKSNYKLFDHSVTNLQATRVSKKSNLYCGKQWKSPHSKLNMWNERLKNRNVIFKTFNSV